MNMDRDSGIREDHRSKCTDAGITEGPPGSLHPSQAEIEQRAAFIAEARTWLGTPFRDQGDVRGPNGAVDCAMLLVRAAVDTGLVPPFDPRPYPPQWHLHRDEERFLTIVGRLGEEVDRAPIPGDVIVYRFGRCYAHGGIIIENDHVLHAYYKTGHVAICPLRDVELSYLPDGKPRPFKLFDLWAQREI
jgi:cell wall-associated NlpC family hydrolase